ncbi:CCR4-NOT transcription complex subunit 10 isoform X2 [Nematostella vectensis]|uniref:CCR4-NOT transcription complex subunit 10 isoform X2 n=1 Tax=Nematostella vectensis TaxID=45351 RepID=UPI0020779288|nr:CCR4-NOT transcription complex subunit 10 isoform X2 [Nematostella vectensis]
MADEAFEENLDFPPQLPPPGGNLTDQERELANQAHIEYEGQQYDKSLAALSKLNEMRPNDYKVVHNKAIIQYCLTGLTRTDEFFNHLATLRKKIEHESGDSKDESDVLDMVYVLYNEAVVCYNLRQYNNASIALGKLFKVIEPLDENLSFKVCFLLTELYLIMHKPDKASAVLNHIENVLMVNNKQADTSQPTTQGLPPTKDVDDLNKARLHQYKSRLNIMIKSMKACKREIKSVLNTGNSTVGLFLKSNFEYLRQNYRKSVKLLNSVQKCSNPSLESGQCINTMYFNNLGCIHYQMHKYNLGAFYFRRALEENDKALSLLPHVDKNNPLCGRPLATLRLGQRHEIVYNLGIQLLFSGRPRSAFDCLIQVVQTYHTNPRLWLRLAECCIVGDQMSCDMKDSCGGKSGMVKSVIGDGIHRKVIISTHREKRPSVDSNQSQSAAMPACTLDFSAICLQNALLLLKACVNLSSTQQDSFMENHFDNREDVLDLDGQSENGTKCQPYENSIPAAPGPPIKIKEVPHLRNSILACSAYVSLGLGDNVTALGHAKNLLSQSGLPGSLKFVGHLYAAEALIKLNRISEATIHLAPENVIDMNVYPQPHATTGNPEKEKDSKPHCCEKVDFPQCVSEGRTTLLVNLASTYCLRNEVDKAKRCLSQACSMCPPDWCMARIVLVAVYVELLSGNICGALQTIKKNQFLHTGKGAVKQNKARLSDYWKN